MGVYIRGMEMPKSCMLCPFCVEEADPANGEMCMVTGKLMPPCTRERLDGCPLVSVPPHGRLIDAEEFLKNAQLQRCFRGDYALLLNDVIEECATVIEAEEGET